MATQIKFGTDGWRGIIADDYTFENVRRVGNAIAHYVHENYKPEECLVAGYDTRFGSRSFAEAISEVLRLNPRSSIKRDAYGYVTYARASDQERLVAALRQAGLPEE